MQQGNYFPFLGSCVYVPDSCSHIIAHPNGYGLSVLFIGLKPIYCQVSGKTIVLELGNLKIKALKIHCVLMREELKIVCCVSLSAYDNWSMWCISIRQYFSCCSLAKIMPQNSTVLPESIQAVYSLPSLRVLKKEEKR